MSIDAPAPPDWAEVTAPGLADLEALAEAARGTLPAPFDALSRDVAIRVVELAPDAILDDLDIDDPLSLTGLYEGTPLPEKSGFDQPLAPDAVWLYRRAILEEWAQRGDIGLGDLIAHIVVHELAHHFGWSDAEIAAIDRWWE